jgi:hypothetical protein
MTTVSAAGQVTENGSALHLAGSTPPAESLSARADTGAKSAVRPGVCLVIPVRNEARKVLALVREVGREQGAATAVAGQ